MKKLRLSFVPFMLFLLVLSAALPALAGQNHPLEETTRLAALAKTWGLLKYYHPEVAKGEIDWDNALITAVPAVKAAPDKDSFNLEIENLITQAGGIDISDYNPGTPANPDTGKMFRWIKDKTIFSSENRKKLETLRKKYQPMHNHYAHPWPGTQHPCFYLEKMYPATQYPDESFRLLGLFRYWNIIYYFFPYKEEIGEPWEPVLEEFIPRMQGAGNAVEYHLSFRELGARLHDGHGNIYSSTLSGHFGYFYAPFDVCYTGNLTVVKQVFSALLPQADLVRTGDIITRCHEQDIDEFRADMKKYANAGNEGSKQELISRNYVLTGASPVMLFTILRNGAEIDIEVPGRGWYEVRDARGAMETALGKWKVLPGNTGYVHLGNLPPGEVDTAMQELMGTGGIIFDLRTYPQWSLYELGGWLNPEPVPFALPTRIDWTLPGSFVVDEPIMTTGAPGPDYYRGKVVVLVDETSMSRSEFYAMALRAVPGSTLIGTPTAGADGDVTFFFVPGGIRAFFSGLKISYPDGSPTQRVGVVPDIEVHPTPEGLRDGRDEVLEQAIRFIENN